MIAKDCNAAVSAGVADRARMQRLRCVASTIPPIPSSRLPFSSRLASSDPGAGAESAAASAPTSDAPRHLSWSSSFPDLPPLSSEPPRIALTATASRPVLSSAFSASDSLASAWSGR